MQKIEYITNSVLNSRTYIISENGSENVLLIDCGDVEEILRHVGDRHVQNVFLSHTHFDHIYGLNQLLEAFPDACVYTNSFGQKALMDPRLNFSHYHEEPDFMLSKPENIRVIDSEGGLLLCDGLTAQIYLSPGHDPSCVTYKIKDKLFTGDAYIPGIKVVTSFPKSDKMVAKQSLLRLQELEETGLEIMPGHSIAND